MPPLLNSLEFRKRRFGLYDKIDCGNIGKPYAGRLNSDICYALGDCCCSTGFVLGIAGIV
jgi:hypothetical protein